MPSQALRLAPRGYAREARSLLRAARQSLRPAPPAKQRFVLFGRGRSGSTLLVDLLDRHPEVQCLGEVLHYPALAPVAFVERELRQLQASRRGFKLLSYQVRRQMWPTQARAIRRWLRRDDVRIFHLQRENPLQHAMSNLYARARNAFHSTQTGTKASSRIHVDPEQLVGWMEVSRGLVEWENRFLGDLERDEIIYETDLAIPEAQQATLERVLDTLGLESGVIRATTKLKPVTPRDPKSFITNWDEIVRYLRDSPYATFLDDMKT